MAHGLPGNRRKTGTRSQRAFLPHLICGAVTQGLKATMATGQQRCSLYHPNRKYVTSNFNFFRCLMGLRMRWQVQKHVEKTWKPNITLFVSRTNKYITEALYLLL